MGPLKRTMLLAFVLCGAGLGTLAALWHAGTLQRWAQARVVDYYLHKVQPHLPFTIEEAQVNGTWRELLEGRISHLAATIRWQDWRARVSGPILLEGNENDFSAEYKPEAVLEHIGDAVRSPPLQLEVEASVAKNFTELVGLRVQATAPRFDWAPLHAQSKDLFFEAVWNIDEDIDATLRAGTLALDLPGRQANLTALDLEAKAPATLKPFAIGPTASARISLQGAEALIGDRYFDLPLSKLPIEASAQLRADSSGAELSALQLNVAQGALTVAAELPAGGPASLRWQTRAFEIKPVIESVIAATANAGAPFSALSKFADFKIGAGRLEARGSLELARGGHGETGALEPRDWSAWAQVRGLAFRNTKLALAAHGADIDLRKFTREKLEASVSIEKAGFRHVQAKISKLPIIATRETNEWDFRIGDGGKLPIAFQELPIEIATIAGRTSAERGFAAESALKLASTDASVVARRFCIPLQRIPPAQFSADFSKIELAPGDIDPTGYAELKLFDGSIHVDEIGFFDLDTPVPEFDFSARVEKIRLDSIGEWLGFGEMDGVLQGYAKDVTFQSWLPTHFDFKMEVKPLNRWKVVFSPDAMKNVVKIFAGEGLDELPGFANWLAFGWPSRIFGGYDVFYAGASIYSSEGTMLLETLDPKNDRPASSEHYILYGPRFRIPLKSSRYPLVMDATSMGNFIRQMSIHFANLARQKAERAKGASSAENKEDKPAKNAQEETHEDCQPE